MYLLHKLSSQYLNQGLPELADCLSILDLFLLLLDLDTDPLDLARRFSGDEAARAQLAGCGDSDRGVAAAAPQMALVQVLEGDSAGAGPGPPGSVGLWLVALSLVMGSLGFLFFMFSTFVSMSSFASLTTFVSCEDGLSLDESLFSPKDVNSKVQVALLLVAVSSVGVLAPSSTSMSVAGTAALLEGVSLYLSITFLMAAVAAFLFTLFCPASAPSTNTSGSTTFSLGLFPVPSFLGLPLAIVAWGQYLQIHSVLHNIKIHYMTNTRSSFTTRSSDHCPSLASSSSSECGGSQSSRKARRQQSSSSAARQISSEKAGTSPSQHPASGHARWWCGGHCAKTETTLDNPVSAICTFIYYSQHACLILYIIKLMNTSQPLLTFQNI